ncbi:lysophospholipid acyltransferase family protein [Galbitalea soli]|uniref:1-acyl-sn-glycerol-3-phosphate acyltransferase n=1 Tax=Galbitalea soli TaxID=1268042 RepID=A0A7C9PLL9_9MICO|nr:lysophospholipid acyltransferase family protein [Galbitalea soli]NEM90310.1 1-acyl-sn-glycerol-3-phosphate acyltransferase [Galbitalea soli]NYJ31018.1 1-acyl-sn-glycerol-3-phosphate acyltransferase [Galbitalea soli]
MFYWIMKYLIAGPLLRVLFRPRVIGESNIPRTGPVIVASNHLSFIDSVILPLNMRRRIYFLAASNYFSGRSPGAWVLKRFLLATGMIPLDRSGGKASEASLRAGLAVLQKGNVLGIYPEGSRSPDGRMHRGRTGIARMVLESGAVVVPVAMSETDRVMPVGGKGIRFLSVGLTFGEPLNFDSYRLGEADHETLRVITDQIMEAIRALSGQEYVDAYSSSRKAAREE